MSLREAKYFPDACFPRQRAAGGPSTGHFHFAPTRLRQRGSHEPERSRRPAPTGRRRGRVNGKELHFKPPRRRQRPAMHNSAAVKRHWNLVTAQGGSNDDKMRLQTGDPRADLCRAPKRLFQCQRFGNSSRKSSLGERINERALTILEWDWCYR